MVSAGMSTLVIGDLHGCGEEFGALLDVARRERTDARVILVGDLFTKGPRPDLVVDLVAQHRAEGRRLEIVCGNHDLRLLEALRRRDAGVAPEAIGGSEGSAIRLLERAQRLVGARRLLAEAVQCVCLRGHGWSVLHGGVVPGAGLEGTSDHDKIHLKAAPHETPWWERYDGRDGLLIVGHKPLREPLMLRRAGRPMVVNVDTGCAYGGALTGYCVEEERFLQVPSGQPARDGFGPTPAATAPQWASGAPARMFARRP
jgi:predicted phosphodiesterase